MMKKQLKLLLSLPLALFLFSFLGFLNTAPALSVPNSFTPPGLSKCVKLVNNYTVTKDTTFCKRNYIFTDNEQNGVIIINADNVTVDGSGLTLDGSTKMGYGIFLNGHSGITIRNFNIKNFYYAVRIENGEEITVENNDVSGNKGSDGTWLDINRPLSAAYGGGIILNQVTNSFVRGNTGINQDVGIDLYSSSNNTIENNNFSNNTAWGIRLYQSTYNNILSNQAHHVSRCGSFGCDSAGILLAYSSNNNIIRGNNITYSGDGFFIGNQNGLPSNNNLIEGNDASYSPNNAFEATFSEGNVFKDNIAKNSNYGFWLGYSSNSRIEGNTIEKNNSDGIAIEHGHLNTIINNTIKENRFAGINLWTDYDELGLIKYPQNRYSYGYTISGNNLAANGRNIQFTGTTASDIRQNNISNSDIGLYWSQADINGEKVNSENNTVEYNNLFCTPPPQVNLALGQATNANVSPETSFKAVDGDKVGGLGQPYVSSYTWNPGTLNPGDWWQVDLGEVKTVQTIIIYPYVMNYHDWLDKFHVVASPTGAFAGEETTVLTVTDFPDNPFNAYSFAPAEARYLRVISDEQRGWIQLQEFEVYAESNVTIYNCQYHFYNYQPVDSAAVNNWWGTNDNGEINMRIYDKNDNAVLGIVNYTPWLTTPAF